MRANRLDRLSVLRLRNGADGRLQRRRRHAHPDAHQRLQPVDGRTATRVGSGASTRLRPDRRVHRFERRVLDDVLRQRLAVSEGRMENKTRLTAFVLGLLMVMTGALRTNAASTSPLKGAWRAVNVGAGQNVRRTVGLAIFTDTHYSIMVFDAESERPDVTDVSKASADDMRGLWAG